MPSLGTQMKNRLKRRKRRMKSEQFVFAINRKKYLEKAAMKNK